MRPVRLVQRASAVAIALFFLAGAGSPYDKVLKSVREDPSFKVRMQAIRVLLKQLKASPRSPENEVIEALAAAATKDEEHLVRGLACYALGDLKDERGREVLQRAIKDEDAFVRAQAEQALKSLEKVSERLGARGRALIVAVDEAPDQALPAELKSELKSLLEQEFQAQGSSSFAVNDQSQGSGYKMSGTIAERSQVPGDGGTKITVVVRIAISTYPENYLRHVVTSKASASAHLSGDKLALLEQKVLKAAVQRAVKDSLQEVRVELE
jgi:HEAT repeat protein